MFIQELKFPVSDPRKPGSQSSNPRFLKPGNIIISIPFYFKKYIAKASVRYTAQIF